MLNHSDFEFLLEMVKNRLELLIIQRAAEENANQDASSLNGEINNLYQLLAKLIISSDIKSTSENSIEIGEVHFAEIGTNLNRLEFALSLRMYWSTLSYAVNSAIQYTHNDAPERSQFDRICAHLAQAIDNLRMFFTNIKESPDERGLYPFEPIKDIYGTFVDLGYGQVDESKRDNTRDHIVKIWKSLREPFLSEFHRTSPKMPMTMR